MFLGSGSTTAWYWSAMGTCSQPLCWPTQAFILAWRFTYSLQMSPPGRCWLITEHSAGGWALHGLDFFKCQSKALSLGGSHISKKIMACKFAASVGDCCAWGGWKLWGRWKNGHWEEHREYDTDRNTGSGQNGRPCFFPVPFRSVAMWLKPAHSHYMCSEFPTAWHWASLVIFFGQKLTSRSASVPVLRWVLKRTVCLCFLQAAALAQLES